ncbi:MAG TPA: hypothetical protein VKK31_01200 [Thermoanaerobaculia bacterium]|nr:hypothetical protein [Thermoanaerobaculia bacterium]
MTQTQTAAQAALRKIVEELDAIRSRLRGVRDTLPAPPQEDAMLADDDEEMDASMRSIIDCVLRDSIEPAIRDLQAVADEPVEK